MLASLLDRLDLMEVNQTLHMFGHFLDWYIIDTFQGLLPSNGILPGAKITVCPSLAFSHVGSITAQHSSSAGRPPRWALAHILVVVIIASDADAAYIGVHPCSLQF